MKNKTSYILQEVLKTYNFDSWDDSEKVFKEEIQKSLGMTDEEKNEIRDIYDSLYKDTYKTWFKHGTSIHPKTKETYISNVALQKHMNNLSEGLNKLFNLIGTCHKKSLEIFRDVYISKEAFKSWLERMNYCFDIQRMIKTEGSYMKKELPQKSSEIQKYFVNNFKNLVQYQYNKMTLPPDMLESEIRGSHTWIQYKFVDKTGIESKWTNWSNQEETNNDNKLWEALYDMRLGFIDLLPAYIKYHWLEWFEEFEEDIYND